MGGGCSVWVFLIKIIRCSIILCRPFFQRVFYYNPFSYYLPRRYGVATLAFLGFCNVYALRVNLSVAIVAMASEEFDWDSGTQGLLLSVSLFSGNVKWGKNIILCCFADVLLRIHCDSDSWGVVK